MNGIVIPSSVNMDSLPARRPQTKEQIRKTLGLAPHIIDTMIQDGKLAPTFISNGVVYYDFTKKFHSMEM